MKKVICKIEYDTDASELIQKKVFGVFGDPKGYEESLYKTKEGKFFLYGFEGNYVVGANIAGFEKVVDAMNAQGIV